jgi:secreted trypsin-like serine protease
MMSFNLLAGSPPDSGHPSVGVVLASNGGQCTGALIAPRSVLTAAHCFDGGRTGVVFRINSVSYNGNAIVSPLYDGIRHDIAVVNLDGDVPNVTPAGIKTEQNWAYIANRDHVSVTLVGTGEVCRWQPSSGHCDYVSLGLAGTKRASATAVSGVYPYEAQDSFYIYGNYVGGCHGDSGGPVFDQSQTWINQLDCCVLAEDRHHLISP